MSENTEKTLQYQEELPSLPLPSLEDTLERYLKSCEPLLTEEELEHSKAVCEDFKNGIGKELQAVLEEKASNDRNWIEEWWETFAYLQPRYPSAININWHGVLPGNWGPRDMSQAEAASIFTLSVLNFRKRFQEQKYPVAKLMGRPLCMYQFTRMFNSCVIPGEDCDSIEVYDENAKHIIVLRNNAIWAVTVLDEDGSILPISEILSQFEAVREEATGLFDLERNPPVSVLTSEERTKWARAREYMMELDETNKESLELVEKALFCIALDQSSPASDEEIANACLLGDGRNRWYDKPFTLVVFENARAGLNGEHAWADAIVVVNLFDHCVKFVNENFKQRFTGKHLEEAHRGSSRKPKRLQWKLDHTAITHIECASAAVSKLIHASDLSTLRFSHFGNDFLKRYKLTPDFFVQMAIQLAYFSMYQTLPAIYETAHTRLFYHGRTETVRSLTTESLNFCKTFRSNASDTEKWDALQTAIKKHGKNLKDSLMGEGVDRHLMGLYIVSEMMGKSPRPAIFTDKAFNISKKYKITTSNISGGRGASPIWGGFSAAYDDGYGVCYAFQPDHISFSIAAYHTSDDTSTVKFRRHLESALLELRELCLSRNVIYVGKSKM